MVEMKKIAAAAVGAIMCGSLFSCGNEDKGTGTGHMFDVPLLGNPESLDPQFADDPSSNTVIKNLYSGLMGIDGSGNVVCRNAESYSVSQDGMVYTFKLRDDNFWFFDENNDDVITEDEYFPVTAEDYAFALRRVLDPAMKSPYAEDFSCIMGAYEVIHKLEPVSFAEIYASDEKTLQIVLNEPNAEFLSLMATAGAFPCNEEFFNSTKGRYGLDDRSVMSNGAFFVRQWFYDPYGSSNILYMKRNDANWSETFDIMPSFLSFTIEKSEEDIKAAFKEDKIECFTSMSVSGYNPEKYAIEGIAANTLGLVFSPESRYFANEKLRKALALSIDRSSLSAELEGGTQTAGGIIPPAVMICGRSYRELASDSFTEYLPDEAKQCYDEAKSELGAENFGEVKILVNAETVNSAYLHVITRSWQELFGLYIGIEDVSAEEFDRRIEENEFDIALYPLRGRLGMGVSFFREIEKLPFMAGAVPEEGYSGGMTGCSTMTELVSEYTAAERAIVESYWFVPVFYRDSYIIASRDNEDIEYDPFTGAVDYRMALNYD